LSFWRLYQADLPNLARIAKIVLAIPASSSKSERVFSTGGLVVCSLRGRLAPSKAEKLIVLKENLALVEDFKENSLYKVQKGEHNAFEGVELEAVAGEGPVKDEEGLELYLEDLEAEMEDGVEGAEEDAGEL